MVAAACRKKGAVIKPSEKTKNDGFLLSRCLARFCKIGAKHRLPSNGFFISPQGSFNAIFFMTIRFPYDKVTILF